MRGKHIEQQPPVKLTRRGEWFLAIMMILLLLFGLALVGGIEQGSI